MLVAEINLKFKSLVSVQCSFLTGPCLNSLVLNKNLILSLSLSKGTGNVCVGIGEWSLMEMDAGNVA